jgi:predicted nucleotidyltransferase component of viral defense system
MIAKRYITQWLEKAPWQNNAQVEQDLILSRVITEIYNNEFLKEHLVFRGGTALNKLFFNPPLRYSEDVDMVQFKQGPIGEIMSGLRKVIDPWLEKPKWSQSRGRVTFYYRFETESSPTKAMKIKIEINTREHGSELDLLEIPFQVDNGWFSGQTAVKTYCLEELISTKLRALFQRRKGRDLFDLYQVLLNYPNLNPTLIVNCFKNYLNKEGLTVSQAEFEENMFYKLQDELFIDDIVPLLPTNLKYNAAQAYKLAHEKLISTLPGKAWEGNTTGAHTQTA